MALKDIMLSEISQTAKDKSCMITYMWNLKTTPPSKLVNVTKTSRLTDIENKLDGYQWGEGKGEGAV